MDRGDRGTMHQPSRRMKVPKEPGYAMICPELARGPQRGRRGVACQNTMKLWSR
jgi:hypothetical protein